MATSEMQQAQQSFEWWLRHTSRGLTSGAALRSRRPMLGDGIEDTLLALRDDETELAATHRGLLGDLQPRTYDEAVRLLLWARHAPSGPRCLSYRASLYFLQALDREDVEAANLQTASA